MNKEIILERTKYIFAIAFGLLIVADAIYGATIQRETLLSWMQIAMGGLTLFLLFGHRITEFAVGKDGVKIKQQIAAAAALGAAKRLVKMDWKPQLIRQKKKRNALPM